MSRRKPTPDRRSRSGPNIPESQRRTVAIKLRVLPTIDAELRRRAAVSGMTVSAVVSALVMATSHDPITAE